MQTFFFWEVIWLTDFNISQFSVNLAHNRTAEQSSTEEGDVASKAIDGRLGNGESSDNLTLRVKITL